MYEELTGGNVKKCIKIYKQYVDIFSMGEFFDKILRPVMHKIGNDWSNNKINIATEHVASNIAQALVRIIVTEQTTNAKDNIKVMLCVPVGEEHHLGCDVLETYLAVKGFTVYNMETSIPTQSILDFIKINRPDAVLVSITIEDNLVAGQRLVKKISDRYDIPILIGGYALQADKTLDFDGTIIDDMKLNDMPKLLRNAIKELNN
jgi:methanogenic corrinoid protein MtbC1